MAHRDADRATAAALLERLLKDADFRARFRVDPRGALADAGVDAMAEQWSQLGEEVQTLNARESRSSLAGAGVAAAIEGFALLGPVGDLVDAAQAADEVRSGHGGAQAPGDAVSPPPAPPVASGDELDEDDPALTPDDTASPPAPAPPADSDGSPDPGAGDEESDSGSADEEDDEADEPDEDEGEEGAGWDAIDEQTDNPETNPDDDSSSGDSGSDNTDGSSDNTDDTDGSTDNTDGSADNTDDTDGSTDDTDGSSDNTDGSTDNTDSDSGAPVDYPGDDAKPAEIAAWMGAEARRRGIPPELPIMAALTESGMSNLDHGDRDSLGFFQMRESIWDNGPYAGYADDPKRQLDWFLDQAQRVGRLRRARGLSTTDPRQYGEWIADVERPAEQYRGRYQGHLAEARSLLAQADDSHGDQGDGQDDQGTSQGVDELVDAPSRPGKQALVALAEARKYMGTPYLWGGSSPKTGFDCSGLVQWAYAKAGIRIPRVTYDQIDAPNGRPVGRNKLLPGDLVFFKNASGDVHHVGISLGGDRFMHAPHTGDVVKISSLKEAYYAREFTGGRRFVAAVAGGHRAADAAQGVAGARAEVQVARAESDAIGADVVKIAMAALEDDNREILRPGSRLHQLLTRQESGKGNAAMFLPAISAMVDQP